jgi:hypothetical protein
VKFNLKMASSSTSSSLSSSLEVQLNELKAQLEAVKQFNEVLQNELQSQIREQHHCLREIDTPFESEDEDSEDSEADDESSDEEAVVPPLVNDEGIYVETDGILRDNNFGESLVYNLARNDAMRNRRHSIDAIIDLDPVQPISAQEQLINHWKEYFTATELDLNNVMFEDQALLAKSQLKVNFLKTKTTTKVIEVGLKSGRLQFVFDYLFKKYPFSQNNTSVIWLCSFYLNYYIYGHK